MSEQNLAPRWFPALRLFVEEMIPSDDLPGAAEARTAEAVLGLARQHPDLAELCERGFAALDAACQRSSGENFATLEPERRRWLLAQLAIGRLAGWPAEAPAQLAFWTVLRGAAVAQFYGSEVGWAVTGFPGPCVDRGGHPGTVVEDPPRADGALA